MKKFLLKILVGVIFFLTVCTGIEFSLPYIANNQYSYKYNYVKKHKDDIKILLMGNSYFANGLNPHIIGDSTFNMAIAARWIYYDKELLKKFVPQMQNLNVVIYPLGYKMLFEWSPNYNPTEITFVHVDYVHEKYMHVWYNHSLNHIKCWFALSHGLNELGTIFRRNGDDMGFSPAKGHLSGKWQKGNNINPNTIESETAELIVAEEKEYLCEMAKICADNGVRFIVVTPPCCDSFVENTREKGIQIMHGVIEDVRQQYPIEYIDYLKDDEFRADSLYYDSSHLNSIGADLFTLRVKEDFGL